MRRFSMLAVALLCVAQCLWAGAKQNETYNMQKAIEAFQNQDYQTAVDCLNKELADDDRNGYAYLWLAIAYSTVDDYGSMLAYSDKAIQYLPKKDKESRGVAFDMRSSAYVGLGQEDLALADISEAIKLDPKDVDYLNSRVQIYFDQERYDLADTDSRKITELEPGNALGWLCLGRTADARGEYAKALEHYAYAIKLNDGNSQCYSLRSSTFINQKRWADAADDVVKSLSLDVYDGIARDNLNTLADSAAVVLTTKVKIQAKKEQNNSLWPFIIGATYEQQGNLKEALAYFNKSFEIEPIASVAQRLSMAYSDADNLEMALDYADRAIQMDSTDTDGLYYKAIAYFKGCRWADAEQAFAKYIDEEPEAQVAYLYRAEARDHQKKYDEAADDYNTAITLQPSMNSYYFLGRHYWAAGDKANARLNFEKALELDTVPDVDSPRPMILGYLGRTAEADSLIEKAVKSVSKNMFAYNYACYYAMFGDKQKAVGLLDKAVDMGFRRLALLETDTDLESVRGLDGYKAVVERLRKMKEETLAENDDYEDRTVEIPMTKEGGVYKVKCTINGLPLYFVFDTGASEVTMSSVEAAFMLKNGYINNKDFSGSANFITASGDIVEGTNVNIRNVNFGGLDMDNVKASVVKSQNAPLLLGQSVLSRMGKVEIDYPGNLIRITRKVKIKK